MNKKIFIFLIVSSVILLNSCNKRIRYIYKKDQALDSVFSYKTNSKEYILKPNDLLHINIITTDKKINELFQVGDLSGNNSRSSSGGEFYLSGFTVNDSGYVQIPILGSVLATGKTVPQFRADVTSKTHEFLNDAIVNVKFVSFKISFLGEVKHEGPIYIYQDNIDVLEAVARAGGITEYGNMEDVTIVRKAKGNRIVYKLDLTNRALLSSERFYLYPDDIVIVKPVKGKTVKANLRDYVFMLSAISTSITTVVLVLSFLK